MESSSVPPADPEKGGDWWRHLINPIISAAVIVINGAIIALCYCYFRNKRCPGYKKRQERLNRVKEISRPERLKHLSYPRQQRVPPNPDYQNQYDSQFGMGNVESGNI